MSSKSVWIAEQWWVLAIGDPGPDKIGVCYHDECRLIVSSELSKPAGIETTLHETIHAECPYLTEDAVSRLSVSGTAAIAAYLALRNDG